MEGRGGGRKPTARLRLEDALQFGAMPPRGKRGHEDPSASFPATTREPTITSK